MNTRAKSVAVRVVAGLGILAGTVAAQAPELKQILASGGGWVNPHLTALSIERGVRYPSVVHLKGEVEIKMKGVKILAGTGVIEATGRVPILPYPAAEAPSRQ